MKNKKRKNKFKKKVPPKKELTIREIILTHEDRITYLYKRDSNGEIIEVTKRGFLKRSKLKNIDKR